MTFFELLFGKRKNDNKKKTKVQIEKEKIEQERKLWELAEEYEDDD